MTSAPRSSTLPTWLRDDGPTMMAIVNVNADSFSDPRRDDAGVDHAGAALAAVEDGATVVDLGAQSAALAARLVPAPEQAAALVPVTERLRDADVTVSVDTYEPTVARATLAAGATILNDYSGRCDEALVATAVEAGAWYVLTHNPVGPRRREIDPDRYGDDVVGHVATFFDEALGRLDRLGIPSARVVLDPGVDVGKTPPQSLALLRGAARLRDAYDNPLLWAVSRKDVVGAITRQRPSRRDPGTLALVGHLAGHARTLLRVHDVRGVADHLRVADAVAGRLDLPHDLLLDDTLRREHG